MIFIQVSYEFAARGRGLVAIQPQIKQTISYQCQSVAERQLFLLFKIPKEVGIRIKHHHA